MFAFLTSLRSSVQIRRKWFALSLLCCYGLTPSTDLLAQETKGASPKGAGSSTKATEAGDTTGSESEALNIYGDAANFQNNRAYELAIAEWKKLIEKFPKDPLASKANHYLGVCYMQLDEPQYENAVAAFKSALTDTKLDIKQETLVDLGWCLYARARQLESGASPQIDMLKEARDTMTSLIKQYPESEFADQALFYAGEAEYALGNRETAMDFYRKLTTSKSLTSSPLRPDAYYALGVCQEELTQDEAALTTYSQLIKESPNFRLIDEVSLRKGDILLKQSKLAEAEKVYSTVSAKPKSTSADYALFRQAFCVSQQNRLDEAAKLYLQLTKDYPDSKYSANATLAAGQAFYRLSKLDEATPLFEKILPNKDTQAAEAAHWLSQIAFRKGKLDEGEKLAREGLQWSADSSITPILKMDLADILFETPAKQDEARKIYEELISSDPKGALAPRAMYNAAFAALQLGELSKAVEWADRFAKDFPDDPLRADVAYVAAESQLLAGSYEKSIATYTTLLQSEKDNPASNSWILRLNTAKYLAGQYDKVIATLGPQSDKFPEASQQAEAYFLVGASNFFLKQYDKAIAQFSMSQKKSSDWSQSDEVLLMLAQAHSQKNQIEQAQSTLEDLLKRFPNSRFKSQAEFRLGQLAATKGDFAKAIERYNRVLEAKPEASLLGFAQYGKAWSLLQQQKFPEALTELDDLIAKSKDEAVLGEARLARGICLRQSGKLEEAITALGDFIKSAPQGERLGHGLYELGLAYAQSKQYSSAADAFTRVRKEVASYPAMDKVLYELGWSLKQQQQEEPAAAAFGELTEKFQESPLAAEAFYHVGQNEYAQARYDRAIVSYASSVTKSTDKELKEKSLYKLGWSHFQKGEYPKAAEQFRTQATDHPDGKLLVDALFMEGESLFKEEKYETAFESYTKAKTALEAKQDKKDVAPQVQSLIYLHGAQCLREQKEWDNAEKWLQVILEKYSDTPYLAQANYELANVYQNQKKTNEAIALYSSVAEKYRTEVAARARFMLGEIYFEQRDFVKAIPEFQRAMYGYGGEQASPEIKNWQARSGFEAGRCSEVLIEGLSGQRRTKAIGIASDFYKYVSEKHPQHELAAQAKKRLEELGKLK